ncbi:KxYKxGKxW signal peptide domain-containing protein, partial [Lactiplantibacillus plantarum]
MNLRTNNPLNSERAVHYKLYKSGKLWIVMGLSVISFIGSTAFTTTFAHADNNVPNQTIVTAAKSKASIEDTDSLTTTSQSSDQASLTASSSNSATTASVQAATMDSTANSNNRPTSQVSTTAVNDSTSQSTSQVAASAVSKSQANIQIASNATAVSSAKPATRVRAMATSPVAMQTKPTAYKIQSKQIIRNQYQWQGNNLYYYGNDGQPITGLRHY